MPIPAPDKCPYCDYAGASTMAEQVAHMEAAHPDVIAKRMQDAGFVLVDGKWVDTLADANS